MIGNRIQPIKIKCKLFESSVIIVIFMIVLQDIIAYPILLAGLIAQRNSIEILMIVLVIIVIFEGCDRLLIDVNLGVFRNV